MPINHRGTRTTSVRQNPNKIFTTVFSGANQRWSWIAFTSTSLLTVVRCTNHGGWASQCPHSLAWIVLTRVLCRLFSLVLPQPAKWQSLSVLSFLADGKHTGCISYPNSSFSFSLIIAISFWGLPDSLFMLNFGCMIICRGSIYSLLGVEWLSETAPKMRSCWMTSSLSRDTQCAAVMICVGETITPPQVMVCVVKCLVISVVWIWWNNMETIYYNAF